ncbi:MAG: MerR family transcriptional regulator [Treponema sp.]|nr:MerR family transcriptional regulator [Treponema sp.]MBR4463842.1 MerR family transcriptional regulator [Treponema sp.]
MASFSIGEVEELTGIKAHILRYWESVIPGFAPRKDIGGRRAYSDRDLDLILRLKFLIYEKKFTIEGARSQLLAEMTSYQNNADTLDEIRRLRSELTGAYLLIRKYRT